MRPATMTEAAFPVPDRIVQLSRAFMGAKTLLSAVELGLFTALAKGPLDRETLRERIGIDRRGACDFFDALVALGLLERKDGSYANTPETGIYLDRGKSTYMGGELEYLNARIYEHWGLLTAALRTGQSQSATANGRYPALYATRDARSIREGDGRWQSSGRDRDGGEIPMEELYDRP